MGTETWPRSTLGWLECSACQNVSDVDRPQGTCDRCGGALLARYRLDEAARTLTREVLVERPANLWRYGELLPGTEVALSLGEGYTPLLPALYLGAALEIERLWIKDESLNPTGSLKARGMACAVTMARRYGLRRLALSSSGNDGGAASAYAALAGLGIDVFFPADTPEPFLLEATVFGARVHVGGENIAECGARVRELRQSEGWFDLSTLREPWRLEGNKTLGFEIAEQLDWRLPDVIVYPTGGGTGLIGMWKAFEELGQLGWIDDRRPRMVAVQAEGCAPIVQAWKEGREVAERIVNPRTYASGLRVPATIGDRLILRAIRESNGTALTVTDKEMAAGQLDLARSEGIFAAPEGGATVAAIRELVRRGSIAPGDRVVLVNTGSGLKYPRIPDLRLP